MGVFKAGGGCEGLPGFPMGMNGFEVEECWVEQYPNFCFQASRQQRFKSRSPGNCMPGFTVLCVMLLSVVAVVVGPEEEGNNCCLTT